MKSFLSSMHRYFLLLVPSSLSPFLLHFWNFQMNCPSCPFFFLFFLSASPFSAGISPAARQSNDCHVLLPLWMLASTPTAFPLSCILRPVQTTMPFSSALMGFRPKFPSTCSACPHRYFKLSIWTLV
uniref:Uncharacterized protein n=1 Tax=Myotis myotis TaxID=51298 RepID=A0A7J7RRV7_MYOMY|nr:hypothetical protein mMyoMyo1_010207 [Myotis myotis]